MKQLLFTLLLLSSTIFADSFDENFKNAIIKKDHDMLLHYAKQAVDNKNTNALVFMGKAYLNGFIVKKDYDKSIKYFDLALKTIDPTKFSMFYEGSTAYWHMAYDLSYMYMNGLGVNKSPEDATFWFSNAVRVNTIAWVTPDENCKMKERIKGLMPIHSEISELIPLLEKYSSNKSNNYADFALSIAYKNGICVKPNLEKAIAHIKKYDGIESSGKINLMIADIHEQFKDYKKTREIYIQEANKNNLEAILKLAQEYDSTESNIVLQNPKKAFELYVLAAKKGNIFSQRKVGEAYLNGNGVKKDMKKAQEWVQKAFENGDEHSKKLWTDNKLWTY